MTLVTDILLTFIIFAIAFSVPMVFVGNGANSSRRIRLRDLFLAVAKRKWLAVLVVGLSSLVVNLIWAAIHGMPAPYATDEYSYLLAADTFARGRLVSPSPPFSEHFDSVHILMRPGYQSMYPPGQGLFLAVGQIIAGRPIVGVWISLAIASAATCWMLQGWMPPRWALLGGMLTVCNIGLVDWWGQSYWGGAVAMTGGALVFGSLRRILRRHQVRDSLVMGLGLAILANSRPYEGLVASLPVAVLLGWWTFSRGKSHCMLALLRVVLPISLSIGVNLAWMAYYN